MPYNEILYFFTFFAIIICWAVFGAAFIFRRRYKRSGAKMRDRRAMIGVLIEAAGFVLVWSNRRTEPLLFENGGDALATLISISAIVIAVFSVWMSVSAIRALGKQWAIAARITDDHQLIINGPYRYVRNPIYTGMLGMLIATGCAVSFWWVALLGTAVFCYGTYIRVGVEERLLRESFGEKFNEYAKSVPSFIPKFTL